MRRLAPLALLLLPALALAAELPGDPAAEAAARSVIDTVHNLSVTGKGRIRSTTETQVCVFCHIPHFGGAGGTNRPLSDKPYKPYKSSTMVADVPGMPSGTSRICLSCHDGTIALGASVQGRTRTVLGAAGGAMPDGPSNLGGRLDRSHPFSFAPRSAPEYKRPLPHDGVKLDASGRLQCTSCHEPHRQDLDPESGNFLVKTNRRSELCLSCHVLRGWSTNPSSHQSSLARFDASKGASTPFTTVADNACASCHVPHDAAEPTRLLARPGEQVCLRCHDGKVAKTDLVGELRKPSAHGSRLGGGESIHDAAEGPGEPRALPETAAGTPRHVTCADCHDAHESFADRLDNGGRAGGALAGVWGITRAGARIEQVQYEYELCFKCHGDSANQPNARGGFLASGPRRAVPEANLRRQFDLGAASFHPIEGGSRGRDVPSLLPPWRSGATITCGDCHASNDGPGNGGNAPKGPHGSIYPHLLERPLSTADRTPEGPAAYALCYKCHDRRVLLSPRSAFPQHEVHLKDGTPCGACHDPHGVSSRQGSPLHNAHLINFDVTIVAPGPKGTRSYTSLGPRKGRCQVACHGTRHDDTPYGAKISQ